jgi:hypothetical protein
MLLYHNIAVLVLTNEACDVVIPPLVPAPPHKMALKLQEFRSILKSLWFAIHLDELTDFFIIKAVQNPRPSRYACFRI